LQGHLFKDGCIGGNELERKGGFFLGVIRNEGRGSDLAYEKIKTMILTMELPPKEPISETILQEKLGLGRTPVREAIQRLSLEYLVDIVPRKGTFVAPIPIEDLSNIYEIRLLIEMQSARRAAERATPGKIKTLKEIFSNAAHIQKGSVNHMEIDRNFHKELSKISGNNYLTEMVERFNNLSIRMLYLVRGEMESIVDTIDQYMEIIKCVEKGDADGAEKAIKNHILESQENVRNFI